MGRIPTSEHGCENFLSCTQGSGRVVGLTPYPGGLPWLHAHRVRPILQEVTPNRPSPLPPGWGPSFTFED